ncbi:MAG TPA: M20/M25/M40 family metallo-hydrolase [Acidimicrobiales bacterium]|nr:M20/M25/M40 family metallo-hydrolase [Acidimicrobiales bacterium]
MDTTTPPDPGGGPTGRGGSAASGSGGASASGSGGVGPPCEALGAALLGLARERFARDALPALSAYTAIECLSPAFDDAWHERGEIARAAELLSAWTARRPIPGIAVEVVEIAGRTPVVLAEIPASDPERAGSTTLVYGHFDKQPPLGEWREGLAPFTAVREGDRLYGRGTADDGYATFAAMIAVEALESAGGSHGRIVLLAESSEESGSPDLETYLDELAGRLGEVSLVVCLDSSCITYDRLWITASLRGNLVCELRVDVLEEAVHSGLAGGIVPSSFRVLRQLLDRIEDASTGEILLPELRCDLPARRRTQIGEIATEFGDAAAGSFPTVPGLELAGTSASERVERGTWAAALALTGIGGVPSVRDGGNVLRPFTAAKLSIRLPPRCDPEAARRALEEALTRDPPEGARVSITWEAPAAGWDAPEPAPWLTRALDEASVAAYGAPSRAMGLGGSIPFMSSLATRYPRAELVATGVLGPASNAHGPNEFLHIPAAQSLTAAIAYLLSAAP